MKGINWLISKAQVVENDADYTLATFSGKLQAGMVRDMLGYCREQGARFIDGRTSSGYNMVIAQGANYRKSIVLIAHNSGKIEFQLIEERGA